VTDLDDAFANGPYIPGADAYPERWALEARAFREDLLAKGRAKLGVSYGPTKRQALDLFLPESAPKGMMIFVHGGYWLKFDRGYWSHFATGALAKGRAVAMPSYDLCPEVRIADITRQIANAVTHIAQDVAGPISLSGHSAGGHLVSRMLAPEVLPPEVLDRIDQVVPISPVTDLRPLLHTSMNADFNMDMTAAEAESPVLQPKPEMPVHVWVGAAERPVFVEQAQALANAWTAPIEVAPERHHFDVIDALLDPESRLVGCLAP